MNLLLLPLFTVVLLYALQASATGAVSTPCQANGLASSYDVVIVGAGLGGSVAARRLAERNPTWKILLVERGITYESCADCQLASTTGSIYLEQTSGAYFLTTPQTHVNNAQLPIKDTAVEGGGTSINGIAHIRGDAFRYFPNYYPINWNFPVMSYYYEKYENYTFPTGFHGSAPYSYAANLRSNKGPVQASQQPLRPFTSKFLKAIKQVYPNMPVYYNKSLNDGFFPGVGSAPPETTSIGNLRVSAYTAYIRSYTGSNLKLVNNVLVNKVLFSGTSVSGVNITFFVGTPLQPSTASCVISTKRVVMSAGALGTPKILKLSGVGPAAELKKFGIPVVANVSAIGANLEDHFVLYTTYTGYTDNLVDGNFPDQIAYAFYNAADNGPDAENDFSYNLSKAPQPGVVDLTTSRTNLNAKGTVTLASNDAHSTPNVDPNYFGNEADKAASALAIFKLRQIGKLLNLTATPDPCATAVCNTPMDVFNAYVNGGYYSVAYHFSSTAALCEATNPVSLRVEGTSGLWVLDASIMPQSPACNTQATLYAVAEHGADLINTNMHLDAGGAAVSELLGWALCEFGSQ